MKICIVIVDHASFEFRTRYVNDDQRCFWEHANGVVLDPVNKEPKMYWNSIFDEHVTSSADPVHDIDLVIGMFMDRRGN
jgi:hypothetical protein